MPYRNMSLEEFAQYVGMDAREVRKLAERGKLPCERVTGQWRFNRARVTEWMQQEMPSMDNHRLAALEQALSQDAAPEHVKDLVTGMMSVRAIDMMLRANSRTSVIRELVELAERTELLWDKEGLLDAVLAREEMCSTAMPNGVAVPHPRQPMPYVSAEPLVCLARTPQGVAFGASSGVLTRLFFLICSHDANRHLYVLARLLRMMDADTVTALSAMDDAEEALSMLIQREAEVAKRFA
jgi:PTS system nitrogen regulatory IIA component